MAQDWEAALALGVRLGAITSDAAARARERIAAQGGDAPAAADVAVWAGVGTDVLERLLGVVDLGTRTGGVAALAEALLSTKAPPSGAEPTLRLPQGAPSPYAPTVASPPARPPLPNVPRRLGPYVLMETLGHGGMGVVFRARHERLGHLCAVKVLIAGEHASAEAIARFQREAASVAKMGKHPNIVTVHDLGQEGSLVWYAMELVEGKSMRAVLAERDVAPEEAARWVEKVARAVHFAHTKGVIHRDLKPDNVVIGADGEPQVMDFGLALDVSTSARLSVTGDVFGSPNYMAPEQARGEVEKSDARTDVYGLGGIMYEALTKIPPHPGRQVAEILASVLRGDVLAPRRLRSDVPRDLETICLKCLDSEQGRRYATAEAFADDLARFLRGEPVVARPIGAVGRMVRRVRRHPLVSSLVAGTVALLLALGWSVGLLAPAHMRVTTDPPDARVETVGATLWAGEWVWPARPFKLRVTRDEYLPREVQVTATPGATIRLESVTLDSAFGTLVLSTEPAGAEVLIDDKPLGAARGAAEFKVAVGSHRLLVRAERHEPHERLITVESGKPSKVGQIKLVRERGTLELTGTPREMQVTVWDVAANKEVTRLSPPATLALDTGKYELRGRLKDNFPRSTRVVVKSGEAVRTDLALPRQLLWACDIGGEVYSSPALGDLNGDGCLDCVVGSDDGRVSVILGRDPKVLRAVARQRLGFYHRGRCWPTLHDLATERLAEEKDPWARATTYVYLGIARARLGQPKEALDAFAEARKLNLRAPDGAVYEWVASRALAGASPERRTEADGVLLDTLGFEPDVVFDTLVECRELLAKTDPADLRAILDRAADTPACALERPLLLALPLADGSRPYAKDAALADLLGVARKLISLRIERGEGSAARNLGYLAFIADPSASAMPSPAPTPPTSTSPAAPSRSTRSSPRPPRGSSADKVSPRPHRALP